MERRHNIAVIPARHHATRFPGKPLVLIEGVPMVVRVARRVSEASAIDAVWVATDGNDIAHVVADAGFEVVMTEPSVPSGTDRVAAALRRLRVCEVTPSVVVNVQGDEPLIDPRDLDLLVEASRSRPEAICTLGRRVLPDDDPDDPHQVKVALGSDGRALYFSRAAIPHGAVSVLHVGVYAYSPSVLFRFVEAPPSALEQAERLEQLRALEMGIPVYVTMCHGPRPSIGVDVPADVKRVEAELRARTDRRTSRSAVACNRGTT